MHDLGMSRAALGMRTPKRDDPRVTNPELWKKPAEPSSTGLSSASSTYPPSRQERSGLVATEGERFERRSQSDQSQRSTGIRSGKDPLALLRHYHRAGKAVGANSLIFEGKSCQFSNIFAQNMCHACFGLGQ